MIQKLVNQQTVGKQDSQSNPDHLVNEHSQIQSMHVQEEMRTEWAAQLHNRSPNDQGNRGWEQRDLFTFAQADRNTLHLFPVPRFLKKWAEGEKRTTKKNSTHLRSFKQPFA